MSEGRRRVLTWGMVALGVAMIVVGAIGGLLPPVLTGIGFLLVAWAHGEPVRPPAAG